MSNKKISSYFIFTFLISWILWSPFYFLENLNEFWVLPGAWGPTMAAILLTYYNKGKIGVKRLLQKVLIWKVPLRLYIFAIFILLLVGSITVLMHKLVGGNFPDTGAILNGMGLEKGQWGLALLLSPAFFLINTLLGGPVAEELGWRGYAQSELQQKYNTNISGLMLGFLWATWHLPLILFMPKAVGNLPVLAYFPIMTAMGVIFSWLYNRTNGSVLLAILLHGGMNFTLGFLGADVFTTPLIQSILVVAVILVALLLATKNKKTVNDSITDTNTLST